MTTLLEKRVCIIKDKKIANWVLKEMKKPSKKPAIPENVRKRTNEALKEGIEWAKKMQL